MIAMFVPGGIDVAIPEDFGEAETAIWQMEHYIQRCTCGKTNEIETGDKIVYTLASQGSDVA